MGSIDLPKSPMVFHPTKRSAVGSRNSLAQESRDQQAEVDRLMEEEVDKVVNHVASKLPSDVLERLDVMGGLKEKLYNYFNQNYQNMFNRYIVTSEDEMLKKVRNFVDREEMKVTSRYTPKEISSLLDEVGGMDRFNTGEIEKSIVNMYGHLQGHIQRGINDLENLTNSLLRQKTDVGAFIRGENAYSVVKCSFKDNIYKPKTVSDVKLSVNILDSELISPIFHYQATVEYIIKDLLSKHIMDEIDKEIELVKDEQIEQGKEEMNDSEIIFEKMRRVENHTSDDGEDPNSKRYSIISKRLMDRVEGLRAEIDPTEFDSLNIRENLKKIIDLENIRNRGFNTAINSITSILDTSKMGYQYIENLKNARELLIREYEDMNYRELPDERYQIKLKYFDNAQLIEERKAYDVQVKSFEVEVQHLWDVLELVYEDKKMFKRVTDYNDLAKIYKNKIRRKIKDKTGDPLYEDIDKVWDEISFVEPAETQVEKMNRTYVFDKDKIGKKLALMQDKLQTMYGYRYPVQRRVIEERLQFLQQEFNKFDYLINPYHIQPGLLLDVDITSIKRKKATLDGMANVLNEFLHGISKGFQDAAFASFSRRRSTVREDIDQHFSTDMNAGDEDSGETSTKGKGYLDMLNSSSESAGSSGNETVVKESGGKKSTSSKSGTSKSGGKGSSSGKKRGRPKKKKDDGLKNM
ncbi:MAG: cytochrome C oxidase subunit II [Spirochaetaceae bacterium]|nr:cytochrome C oxidase subunit II [Spirochaetaceae bacterium]MCF7948188.1 cytochrome C oxidase subunit II [Spirochaetia bacterium]MCF7950804.1 cytochrome C oxidase subunit II [Spirochaetaceae bacterium]